jgi:hypothetical protein
MFLLHADGRHHCTCPGELSSIAGLNETVGGGVDWIHLAQDSEQWWALMDTVVIFVLYERREMS